MIHPWKGKSFEEFVKKQEHRLEDVAYNNPRVEPVDFHLGL